MSQAKLNDKLPIFQIPKELFLQHSPFHIKDVLNLKESCKNFSFFRAQSEENSDSHGDAYLLMHKLHNFHFKDAQSIATKNPNCIIQKICYVPYENKVALNIQIPLQSPLQFAFSNYDSYMWNMFYETIKDNPILLATYKRQLSEVKVTEHFNINPLSLLQNSKRHMIL